MFDTEVEAARAQLAKTRAAVMQKEKNMKKTEKALEGKVIIDLHFPRNCGLIDSLSSDSRTGRHRSPDRPCYTKNEQCRGIQRRCRKTKSQLQAKVTYKYYFSGLLVNLDVNSSIWYLLQDFMLTLVTIQSGMLLLLPAISKNTSMMSSSEEVNMTQNVQCRLQ